MKYLQIIITGLLISVLLSSNGNAQITRVEPPFWWTSMKNNQLQLMVYGDGVAEKSVSIRYPGLIVSALHQTNNRNYLFIDLELSPDVEPGNFTIEFSRNNKITDQYVYTLKEREKHSHDRRGFDNSDVIYLVMPDRYANGNPENDNIPGMPDRLNRKDPYGRHGGDLAGLSANVDYFERMGFTAIWLNPVLENNQKEQSYHGYAVTDFYSVDPRLGTNDDYKLFSNQLNLKGMKLIKDVILNHCGSEHWWMKDMPSHDWINFYPEIRITNHRRTVNQDPYASEYDRTLMTDGWFVPQMPDMNQRNPFLAEYLIQNTIWWIEFAGLSGLRVDTYPYPDKNFMADWNRRILVEYPGINIVGEEWSPNPAIVSYWQKNQSNRDGYQPNLPSLMDFPLQIALKESLLEKEEWERGLHKLHESLSNDFLYPDPFNLVIFADNHDMSRFYVQMNNDINLYKLGIVYILTTRGIPQIYYGSEVLMNHRKNDGHGNIRKEFPGGWPDHRKSAFSGQGLTNNEIQTQEFFAKLLNWRKESPQIHSGRLMHFAPEDGVYVFFRYNSERMTMVVLNKNKKHTIIDTKRFKEILQDNVRGVDVITGRSIHLKPGVSISPMSPMIIDIQLD